MVNQRVDFALDTTARYLNGDASKTEHVDGVGKAHLAANEVLASYARELVAGYNIKEPAHHLHVDLHYWDKTLLDELFVAGKIK